MLTPHPIWTRTLLAVLLISANSIPVFSQEESLSLWNKEAVLRVVKGPANSYYTYSHSNAFLPDGHTFVAAQSEGVKTRFIAVDPAKNIQTPVGEVENIRMFYSISNNGLLAFITNDMKLEVLDITKPGMLPKVVAQAPESWRYSQSPDISADGHQITVDRHEYTAHRHIISVYNVETGKERIVTEKSWLANHACFFPSDNDWIMFVHSGNTPQEIKDSQIEGRIWAWNEEKLPEGKMLFTQKDESRVLSTTHPIPMYHKRSILFVMDPESVGMAPGLYEVNTEGEYRCVSPSDYDLHCNISRDGRLAVVDTRKMVNEPSIARPKTSSRISDIVLVNMANGKRLFLYRSTMKSHPYHVHPHISPDGRWIVFTDFDEKRAMALELNPEAIRKLLE